MKRFVVNMWVFILLLPFYVLLLASFAYEKLVMMPLIKLGGKANQEPYKWFDNLDARMYKLNKDL